MRHSTFLSLLTLPILTLASPQTWSTYPQNNPTNLTPWEQIHQAIHLYGISLDTKNWSLLSRIFTANARANYTAAQIPVTNTVDDLAAAVTKSLSPFVTQHLFGTTVIDIDEKGDSANSTAYVQATHWIPGSAGQPLYVYCRYLDRWVRTAEGWRSEERVFELMGNGFAGNLSILG